MPVASRRLLIQNKKGLHARAAAKLVKTAGAYTSRISITRLPRPHEKIEPATVMATSILGVLMLAGEKGVEIDIDAEGDDAAAAVEAIAELVNNKFDEGE